MQESKQEVTKVISLVKKLKNFNVYSVPFSNSVKISVCMQFVSLKLC